MMLAAVVTVATLASLGLASAAGTEILIESFDATANCPGLERETGIVHEGAASGRWSRMDRRPGVSLKAAPRDWNAYNALSLWVYNAKILPDTAFMMIIGSERKESEGSDYYALRFDLGRWTGWKHFLVPFAELGVARQPLGFQHIDGVSFTARGYGNTPNPEAMVCFDDFRLLRIKRVEGPRLTDAELFAAMNLDDPALAPIRRAVAAGDFSAAKAAWLEHLKARKYPRWSIDWHQRRPARPAPPPGGSPGWDYYSHHIRFDWSGWRHFHLEKKDFHAARKPIGWNWIDSLSFTAAGFGQTPDPKAVLYFDDVRLVGRKRTVALGDFEHGPGAWEGLVASDEQAKTGRCFPYAGQMVMRSGWDPEARYLLMDAGPFGFGHQHEDKLSIVVHAYGKLQITDPGNYHYDSSPWRRYTIDTPAHNTVMVDGLAQCRRSCDPDTYVVKQPPATNVWLCDPKLDYAAGQYDEGYGPQRQVRVVHRREIVFVKPDYWLVVDRLDGRGAHRYQSLFHFDADEAQVDASGTTVRTIDPAPNCLVAAARQRGLELKIVKGQTEPSLQGFVASQQWRPSWKQPKAKPPEHGKREVPTAIFSLSADGPARLVYVIYPYRQGQHPQVTVEDLTGPDGRVRVEVLRPDGSRDQILLDPGAEVTRSSGGASPLLPWASVRR